MTAGHRGCAEERRTGIELVIPVNPTAVPWGSTRLQTNVEHLGTRVNGVPPVLAAQQR